MPPWPSCALEDAELGNMQRSVEDLVKTYLGELTGKQVFAGRTKRCEGEKYMQLSGCA